MLPLHTLLQNKIKDEYYQTWIGAQAALLSEAEQNLLYEILAQFHFDVEQTQALAQALMQQRRFDPNASHVDEDDVTDVCLHCLYPPMPPLRDYYQWRQQLTKSK